MTIGLQTQHSVIRKLYKQCPGDVLRSFIHVNDPTNDQTRMADKEKGKEILAKDPLYKVSPLMEGIRK